MNDKEINTLVEDVGDLIISRVTKAFNARHHSRCKPGMHEHAAVKSWVRGIVTNLKENLDAKRSRYTKSRKAEPENAKENDPS